MDGRSSKIFKCIPCAIGIVGGFLLVKYINGHTYMWMMYYASAIILLVCIIVSCSRNRETLDTNEGATTLYPTVQERLDDINYVNLSPSAPPAPILIPEQSSELLYLSDSPPNYESMTAKTPEQSPPPYSSIFDYPQTTTSAADTNTTSTDVTN